jgi:hypothetical protein
MKISYRVNNDKEFDGKKVDFVEISVQNLTGAFNLTMSKL